MIQPPNNTSLVDWLEGKLAFDFCLHYHACQIAAIPQSLHVNTPFSTFNPRVSNFPSFQRRKCDRANRYNYWVVGCKWPVPPTVYLLRRTRHSEKVLSRHTHRLLLIVQNYIWLQRSDSHPHLS